MKKAIFPETAIIMAVAVFLITPTLARSTTILNLINSNYSQSTSQTGPLDTIDQIISWLGYDPLVGPGGGLTGATIYGTHATVVASAASMLNVSWYEVWKIGQTNDATDLIVWAAIYQLNGDPGASANISLNYTYNNSRLNLVADGRSESKSSASFAYDIVPASMIGQYSQNAMDALGVYVNPFYYILASIYGTPPPSPWPWDYQSIGSLSYDENFYFAAMTWADDTTSGSFPVGSMAVGDQLYFIGALNANSQSQAYYMGVEITTMVSSLNTELVLTEIPPTPSPQVPEPTTILLYGLGFAGAGVYRRLRRR